MKIAVSFLKMDFLNPFQGNGWSLPAKCVKTPVGEWHFASKNQLPGLSISATLAGNELIQQMTFHILITW